MATKIDVRDRMYISWATGIVLHHVAQDFRKRNQIPAIADINRKVIRHDLKLVRKLRAMVEA